MLLFTFLILQMKKLSLRELYHWPTVMGFLAGSFWTQTNAAWLNHYTPSHRPLFFPALPCPTFTYPPGECYPRYGPQTSSISIKCTVHEPHPKLTAPETGSEWWDVQLTSFPGNSLRSSSFGWFCCQHASNSQSYTSSPLVFLNSICVPFPSWWISRRHLKISS